MLEGSHLTPYCFSAYDVVSLPAVKFSKIVNNNQLNTSYSAQELENTALDILARRAGNNFAGR